MTEELPNVTENTQSDVAIQLMLCRPWRESRNSYFATVRDVFNLQVAWQRGEPGALTFSTYKDSPGAKYLMGHETDDGFLMEYSIAVRIWDPRRGTWVEPPNSRFVVDTWEEDVADGSNRIDFTCQQEVVMLNKARLHRVSGDWRVNNEYDRAKERFDEAEREYERLLDEATRIARRIQRSRFGHTRGRVFIGYRGTDWIARSRGPLPWGTLAADQMRGRIMLYRPSDNRWVRLPGNIRPQDRDRLIELSNDVRRARTRFNQAQEAYAKAERAHRETSRDGTRFWYNRTPARVLVDAWVEASERQFSDEDYKWWHRPNAPTYSRNQLAGFWRDWTATHDSTVGRDGSGGRRWLDTTPPQHWEFPLGVGFLDMVQDFRERGLVDWVCRGRTFTLVPHGALEVDQYERVALRLNQDVEEARERGSRLEHASVSIVQAGNGYTYVAPWEWNVKAHATPWGRWEDTISESEADSQASARRLTYEQRRERQNRFMIDSTRRIKWGIHSPIPMVDYEPHHWISVYDHEGARSRRIVDQIIVSHNEDGEIEATITLGQRRTRKPIHFAKTLSKTLGGIDHIQGHIPMEARLTPPEVPTDALWAPPLVDLQAFTRADAFDGRPSVMIRAAWAEANMPEPPDAGADEDPTDDLEDDGREED